MNVDKYFGDVFNAKCVLTNHAITRLNERFMFSELDKLKLLIQAGLRAKPLNTWENDSYTAIVDPRFNFSVLSSYYPEENVIKIITFIRGKTPDAYKNCKTITVSIMKEKADQDVALLNDLKQKMKSAGNKRYNY